MADEKESVVVAPAETVVAEVDALTKKDEEIAKLKEERDNYRKVALKRKGKLPADEEFFAEEGKEGPTVEDQVKLALMESELARKQQEREVEIHRITKENSELRLALKNQPGQSIGGDSGTSTEVKDNVFSAAQLEALKQRALRLKADPEKFIESAKKNLLKSR